jgi:hypothetical protein
MTTLTLSLLLALAQDGGKLDWKGKSGDPAAAMAEAGRLSKPLLLFFTSEG